MLRRVRYINCNRLDELESVPNQSPENGRSHFVGECCIWPRRKKSFTEYKQLLHANVRAVFHRWWHRISSSSSRTESLWYDYGNNKTKKTYRELSRSHAQAIKTYSQRGRGPFMLPGTLLNKSWGTNKTLNRLCDRPRGERKTLLSERDRQCFPCCRHQGSVLFGRI